MTKTKQLALCALMTALALALSYAERFLPLQLLIPLPGVKLGLANVVTLVALYLLKKRHALVILLLRCFLGAVFGGGISGLAMSLTGGLLALGVMVLSRKSKLFSIYGVSILGAACHNTGQILAAMVLMNSVYVAAYLPYLLLVALVTGSLTACACAGVLKILKNASISPS
ncbi:MAG: Gx transporter family protein [Oscillospiraceae bacterium]|nr:Gx transporter family protein [Oscillospiraceae bacterium]